MGDYERRWYEDRSRRAQQEAQREAGGPDVHWGQQFVGHTLEGDLRALGLLALPTSEEELAGAWRELVKAKAGQPGVDMDDLKKTRDRLRETLRRGVTPENVNQLTDSACKLCGGSGRLKTGFGAVCPACNGTGQRNG